MTSKSESRCAATDFKPDGLGERAAALWSELIAERASVTRQILAGEACRLTDRLDRLDAKNEMTEARQTAVVLRQILGQLAGQQAELPGGSIADEVAARRAARESGATG
jgi:hypothetical protein